MEFLKLLLIVVVLVAIGVVFLAIRILLKRNGQFPETHVGHNRNMRSKGITCVKTMDRMEQQKTNSYLQNKYKGLRLVKDKR